MLFLAPKSLAVNGSKLLYKKSSAVSWPLSKTKNSFTSKSVPICAKFCYPQVIENQINKQIRNELQMAYNYLALATNYARTDIALTGSSNLFQVLSEDEMDHAKKLIRYQLMRGGTCNFEPLEKPKLIAGNNLIEALRYGLENEKKNSENLNELIKMASDKGDITTQDWVMQNLMNEQMCEIQHLGNLITRLETVGPTGFGLIFMDRQFKKDYGKKINGNNEII